MRWCCEPGEGGRSDWGAPVQAPGLEIFKQVNTMLRAAFPDPRLTVEEMVVEGERVSVRFTARGTRQGEFWGRTADRHPGGVGGD